jgi:NAD+ kinase
MLKEIMVVYTDKILVIFKKSTYDFYNNSPDQAVRDYLKSDDANVKRIIESHNAHSKNLESVLRVLEKNRISYDALDRTEKPDFSRYDLVISVGGDGTFLDIGHYVRGTPILGVNSDPERSRGMLCYATAEIFEETLMNLDNVPRTQIGRLEVSLNDNVLPELVINEALLYHKDRGNLRFELEDNGLTKRITSCYDFFVATAVGSTGSVYNFGSMIIPTDSNEFTYYITGNREEIGKFHFAESLGFSSLIREGVIQLDGEHTKYTFSLGDKISFRYGEPLARIGDLEKNRIEKGFV